MFWNNFKIIGVLNELPWLVLVNGKWNTLFSDFENQKVYK